MTKYYTYSYRGQWHVAHRTEDGYLFTASGQKEAEFAAKLLNDLTDHMMVVEFEERQEILKQNDTMKEALEYYANIEDNSGGLLGFDHRYGHLVGSANGDKWELDNGKIAQKALGSAYTKKQEVDDNTL